MKNDPTKIRRFIGRRIAELRVERGVTQERLAETSDVDARYLQRIEAGEINLTVDTLCRIANVLRVSVAAIFSSDTPTPARPRHSPAESLRNARRNQRKT